MNISEDESSKDTYGELNHRRSVEKLYLLPKPKTSRGLGRSIAVTCLLAMRQSSLRWHDFYLGFCMELGNLNINAGLFNNFPPAEWGKDKGKQRSTEDIFRGGLTRSSGEVSVMGMERRGRVIQSNFNNNSVSKTLFFIINP